MSAVLILSEVTGRDGEVKRFDVKRAAQTPTQALAGIPAGEYKVLDGGALDSVEVSYRTVQDLRYA